MTERYITWVSPGDDAMVNVMKVYPHDDPMELMDELREDGAIGVRLTNKAPDDV